MGASRRQRLLAKEPREPSRAVGKWALRKNAQAVGKRGFAVSAPTHPVGRQAQLFACSPEQERVQDVGRIPY